jgi:palmitoyltransferase
MKIFLLRSLNRIGWCYAYLGLIYALYFIYFIVVPVYREQNRLSNSRYLFFNIIFFYFFLQGYFNLIRTTFSSISLDNKENIVRYCQFCLNDARERSHHCYLCQSCIPIQDHHCFFVGTCIGKHNQRYFLLMLFHLLCAHLIGYIFICEYFWNEIGGFKFVTILKILFFNIGYLIGFVETKWQAFICFHHYLAYFDMIFMSRLFYQIMKRSLNGQTQYEEKKMIFKNKQTFSQIFGSNKLNLIFPFIRS